jgi:hypothetical protein
MRLHRHAALLTAAIVLCLPLIACRADTRDVAVDRYDVAIVVLPDGALEIRETVALRALAPDAQFVRDIPRDRVDQISELVAAVDAGAVGGSSQHLQVDVPGARVVRSRLENGRAETLTIRYHLSGALEAQGPRGLLRWSALPTRRPYSVAASRISVSAPPAAIFTAGPLINDGRTPASRDARGLMAELSSIDAAQLVVVSGEIDLGGTQVVEPEWQVNGVQAWRLMPAFLAGGACLIVIAIGVLVMIRLHLVNSGLAEVGQLAVRKGLGQTGCVAIALAILTAATVRLLLSHLGIWPMAMPVGLAVMGALFIRAAGRLRR